MNFAFLKFFPETARQHMHFWLVFGFPKRNCLALMAVTQILGFWVNCLAKMNSGWLGLSWA